MSGRDSKTITPFILSNDDLIEAYRRSGATADFDQIVARFAALVFNECRRVTRNPHDAEDAAQLTFLALAIELKSGTLIRQPGAWLQRVARRQALKIVRSRGRRQRREAIAGRDEAAPLEPDLPALAAADQAVTAGIVRDAIDALPEHYRLPLVLHYFGGMKLESIAHELGVSKQAVGTRLHRARKMLGDRLTERGIRYDAGTLAGLIALLVPAGVVAALVRSVSAGSAVPGTLSISGVAKSAVVAQSVSSMLRATAVVASSKPLMAMCATIAISTATGFAYVGPGQVVAAVRERIDVDAWVDWLVTPPQPTFDFVPDVQLPTFSNAAPAVLPVQDDRRSVDADWAMLPLLPEPSPIALPAKPMGSNATAVVESQRPRHALSGWPLPPIAPPVTSAEKPPIDPPAAAQGGGAAPVDPSISDDAPPVIHIAPSGGSGGGGGGSSRGGSSRSSMRDDFTIGANSLPVPYVPHLRVGSPAGQTVHIAASANLHAGSITVGERADDDGEVIQDGGKVVVDEEVVVGDRGVGAYTVDAGGTLTAHRFTIGRQVGSTGSVWLTSGSNLELQQYFRIGDAGVGRLYLGSAEGGATITIAYGGFADSRGGSVVVRSTHSGSGLVSGWGVVNAYGGTFVNNDRVVADGFGKVRTLDLSSFQTVVNTIDNPVGGNAGWYVQNGGRIALPSLQIRSGTGVYTWGESASDPRLDLINSLRFTVHDQPTNGTALAIVLRSLEPSSSLPADLPDGFLLSSLWELRAGTAFDPSAIDVVTRYDDRLARLFADGGNHLSLLGLIDGEWEVADAGWLNHRDKLIGGRFDGAIDFLAVGINLGGLVQSAVVQTPEPALLVAIAGAATLSLSRRRRQISA